MADEISSNEDTPTPRLLPVLAESSSIMKPVAPSEDTTSVNDVLTEGMLCETCQSLRISKESFVISESDRARLVGAAVQTSANSRAMQVLPLRSGIRDINLGTFQAVRERSTYCVLCALISDSVQKYSDGASDEERTNCYLRWELDGHELPGPFSSAHINRTRRLRIMWSIDESKPREAFLVFVAPTSALRPHSDAISHYSKGRHFLGRDIEPDKGKQALIRSWLSICSHKHGNACKTKVTQSREFAKLLDETYFGVIDVYELQLVPLPRGRDGRPARYAALSYVWGKLVERPYTTLRVNALLHREQGGLGPAQKKLPRAMRDAIDLVQKLGIRYLWIDALCIVQDSPTCFRLNAQAMHTVFGNAYMTICAADGHDAWKGLVAMHDSGPAGAAGQMSKEIVPGVRLQVSRPAETVIRDSTWNTRAWTFQERLLSRRCLIFAEGRVYFQCRRAAWSEDVHNETSGSSESFQTMGAPLRYFAEIERRSLWFYMTSVAQFYRRELTRPRDILSAYNGIEAVLGKVMRAPFYFGLPSSHFDFALLWQPLRAAMRRTPTENDDFGGSEFPSWSWSGWIGGDVGYDSDVLEGCLLNVQEWLREHTWIRYYIRDGRGRLRPLWDREKVDEDVSAEPRWRGYTGYYTRENDEAEIFEPADYSSDSEYDSSSEAASRRGSLEREELERRRRRTDERRGHSHSHNNDRERRPVLQFLRRRSHPRSPARPREIITDTRYEYHKMSDRNKDVDGSEQEIEGDESPQQRIVVRTEEREYITTKRNAKSDYWGRPVDQASSWSRVPQDRFSVFLPENPYGVTMTDFKSRPSVVFPDMPILQFWTFRTLLQVVVASSDPETGLSRCHVGDQAGDWCGTVTLNTEWIEPSDGRMFDFIALSEAKAFTKEEHPVWTYYAIGEREDSVWGVYYALLVKRNQEKHVWERAGLAKIFRHAFRPATWDEIILG